MIFTALVLENFGAYAGRNVVDLEPPGERPVVLVGGQNGEGKTTILEAIQLALYGPRSLAMNGHSGGYDAYLVSKTNHNTPDDAVVAVELVIRLTHEAAERELRVRRSWSPSSARAREMLEVFDGESFDSGLSEGWAEFIESLVPRGVAPLFFFDGERIEALADFDGAAETLRTAVGALLGLDLVDRLGADLKALERRHSDKAASAELRAALEAKDSELAELSEQLSDARKRHAALMSKRDQCASRLGRADESFAREGGESYEARAKREAEVESAATRLQAARGRLREIAAGVAPLALLASQLESLLGSASAEHEEMLAESLLEVLEQRDEQALSQLDHKLEEKSSAIRSHLAEWFAADRTERALDNATGRSDTALGQAAIKHLEALSGHVLPEQLRQAGDALSAAEAEASALEEAERRLGEVPGHEAIEALIVAREKARSELQSCEEQLSEVSEEIETLERRHARSSEEQERVMRRVAEEGLGAEDSQRILVHCERARDTLAALRDRAATHHMARIEKLIEDSLRSLLRKRCLVERVKIDPTSFELHLLGKGGRLIEPRKLSAGERQLTALALLWGLARASSRMLPVIIDTPLARLDKSHRELFVSRYLPSASHQVIVLSTDTEVDEGLLPKLAPAIGRSYRLMHDDRAEVTAVGDGYFFDEPIEEVAAA